MRISHCCTALLSALLAIVLCGPSSGEPTKLQPACNRALFRTVVDVGHTAEEPGAMSAHGKREYDFNLNLATLIERTLRDDGFAKTVLLITGGSARRGLIQRVATANAAQADLFLSIHHDSVPDSLMDAWDHDGTPRRFSDRFKGHSIFVSYDNADRVGSLQFAKLLGGALKDQGLSYTRHYTESFMGRRRRELLDKEAGIYRFDRLHVLRGTRMPAVLFEAGMIVNRDEELSLSMPGRQDLIASAVTAAVERFCAGRQAAAKAARRKPAKKPTKKKP